LEKDQQTGFLSNTKSISQIFSSNSFTHQSLAFLYVIFERFGRIVAIICQEGNAPNLDGWEETMMLHRMANWNLLSCKLCKLVDVDAICEVTFGERWGGNI
jgi:hypothetical protein